MKRPDAGNVRLETQTSLLHPKFKASLSLPNAHAPLEVDIDRPGLPSGQRHARPKLRPSWAMVLGLWHAFKCLGRVYSNLKSIFAPWALSTWKHLAISGTVLPSIKFAMQSIEPSTARSGPNSKLAGNTKLFMRTLSRIKPRNVSLGLSKSPTFSNGLSIWQSRLFPTMLSTSKVSFCVSLDTQKRQAKNFPGFRGLTGCHAQSKILSGSFVGDF
jgi:hypothetical protein